jgi:phosphopantetheinyl transferase (holo-ACP synthase)
VTGTGNDIIAIQHTRPALTRLEKYYSKIIGGKEIELYQSSGATKISFENFTWLAWSIKESVYKFLRRQQHEILFSPTKIIVQKLDLPGGGFLWNGRQHEGVSFDDPVCCCSTAQYAGQIFFTRSLITETMIFTVAGNHNNFDNVYWGIKHIDDDSHHNQSKSVRDFMKEKLQSFFPGETVQIEKHEAGYPFVKHRENMAVSFSHHGNYVAYTFVPGHPFGGT